MIQSIASTKHRNASLFVAYGILGAGPFVGAVAGLPYFPPVLFAAFRIDVGAVLLLSLVVVRGGYWYPKTRKDVVGVFVTYCWPMKTSAMFPPSVRTPVTRTPTTSLRDRKSVV